MDDVINFTRFILSFLFVIGLIGCLAFLLKYFADAMKMARYRTSRARALQVVGRRAISIRGAGWGWCVATIRNMGYCCLPPTVNW